MTATTRRVVSLHLRYGMIMFIASEVMFFVAWFWAFFDASLFPGEPQQYLARGVHRRHLAAEGHRGVSIPCTCRSTTRSSCCCRARRSPGRTTRCCTTTARAWSAGLVLTVALGVLFSIVQAYEYMPRAVRLRGQSIYGATFFMATGFHGFHVLDRHDLPARLPDPGADAATSRPKQHFGFEAAAWYWHFVDVVWLFLFAAVYVWGGWGAPMHGG